MIITITFFICSCLFLWCNYPHHNSNWSRPLAYSSITFEISISSDTISYLLGCNFHLVVVYFLVKHPILELKRIFLRHTSCNMDAGSREFCCLFQNLPNCSATSNSNSTTTTTTTTGKKCNHFQRKKTQEICCQHFPCFYFTCVLLFALFFILCRCECSFYHGYYTVFLEFVIIPAIILRYPLSYCT